ncbi:hypothetical protein ACFFHJ_22380 [Planotetraspora thailandica]|uniref:hypothetical protein n=1 Tax=Planotetraspora thailandica TaxID=487172 RepID=UPI00194F4700|nr:hypothetical protein [Planotetraspora thailandica]
MSRLTAAGQVRPRWTRPWGLLLCVVALGTLFVDPPGPRAVKDDAFITAETPGILNIEGGECFTDPVDSTGSGRPIVLYRPCPEHADNQSYGFVHAADGAWERTRLAAFAWKKCGEGFTHYWAGKAASGLDFYPVMPTEKTWADGDRDIMCVVYRPGGELTESAVPLA